MKTRIHLLFFIISFFVSHTAVTQENLEKTKIVTTVFDALKKQDEKKFLKSLPTKGDIKYLIPIAQEAQPNENIPEADSIIAKFKIKAIENFRKVIKKGTAFGVLWEDIVLQNVKYEANPDLNVNIERGNFIMECTSYDKRFLITMKKSSKIRGTWRLMNTIKFTLL
ncbi:hypothetical protein [uncultured Formosa sp.]|uniref:hypothetical protein n=1 Tax=uncultured Formosa sp. TaxID=255435 RepID=UPI00260A27B4|nr:hypothetical protein [uncultured Formosa sp.]